ncbi:MAG: hypothetical protein EXX96DRAFT_305574 [Benjaminiella poitrasii]|nr:MAG: hypothetical protein EXX96DRAFT_305574 [Benjaminiella poitrasii]
MYIYKTLFFILFYSFSFLFSFSFLSSLYFIFYTRIYFIRGMNTSHDNTTTTTTTPKWPLHLITKQLINTTNTTDNRLSEITTVRNSVNKKEQQSSQTPVMDDEQDTTAWWILSKHDQDGFYSVCALFFLFGFIFPPFWWIGSFWPKRVKEKGGKMADRWQKLNRMMSIGFSIILIVFIIIFVIIYSIHN